VDRGDGGGEGGRDDDGEGLVEDHDGDDDDDGLRFLSICNDTGVFDRIDPKGIHTQQMVCQLCSFLGSIGNPWWQLQNGRICHGVRVLDAVSALQSVSDHWDSESRPCIRGVCPLCSSPRGSRTLRTDDEARSGICTSCTCTCLKRRRTFRNSRHGWGAV